MSAALGSTPARAAECAARAMERCAALARITEEPGQILRRFLSPAMDEVHWTMRPWMEGAGMEVAVDRAGNLRGFQRTDVAGAQPRLLIGSHLDTVPNAGAYDGVLGVLIGLALVECAAGCEWPFGIETIGFSDEEGTRFGAPFLGSRAVVGELDATMLQSLDGNGISAGRALASYAEMHPALVAAELHPDSAAYLEFHIEQGPVLEERGLALGVVEALAGQTRASVTFHGRSGHAGTTPMGMRRDALTAAAEWMARVEAIAGHCEGLVATVGQISAEPGAVNVIPETARCSLDVRHEDDAVRTTAVLAIFDEAHSIAARRGVSASAEQYHSHPAVRLDPDMVALAEGAVTRAGYPVLRMTSGAGHDAMVMASHLPSAMIFLRNPGGLSHHPGECIAEEDVAAGIHAGMCFLEEFAAYLKKRESDIFASSGIHTQ